MIADPGRLLCPAATDPVLSRFRRRALGLQPDDPCPRCWSWSCPGCSHLKQWGLKRYLRGGAIEAARRGETVLFWTLTEPPRARGFDGSSAALTRLFAAERKVADRAGADALRWAAVPELQERGAVHWHGMVAGDDAGLGRSAFRSKHRLHDRAYAFGFGFQADLQELPVLESPRLAAYLAKYCAKDVAVISSVTDRYRRMRSSVGRLRWFSWTLTDATRRGIEASVYLRELTEQLERGVA